MPKRKSQSEQALKDRAYYRIGYYKRGWTKDYTIENVYKLLERLGIPSMFCKVDFIGANYNIKILVPQRYRSRVRKKINEVWFVPTEVVVDAIIITEIDEWKSLK